jgi:hypothetical protein
MDETRRAPRRPVLKAGSITFGGGAIDCVVRNLSATGAALEVTSLVGIPDQFALIVAADVPWFGARDGASGWHFISRLSLRDGPNALVGQ